MTEEQKRIKIAEACGWKPYPKENVGAAAVMFNGDVWFRDEKTDTIATPSQLPDYFNDLNACHEMEKALPEYGVYFSKLEHICQASGALRWASPGIWSVHSTASQRAEAFGRALGLWREWE